MDSFLKKKSQQPGGSGSSSETLAPIMADDGSLILPPLESTDPNISAFYAQLSEKERIAHALAIIKLGTSYDVVRTHAYVRWLKSRSSA
jgi:hypothetical protein